MVDRTELSRLCGAELDAAHGSPEWELAYEELMDYLLATMPNTASAVVGRHGNLIVRGAPGAPPMFIPKAAVLRLDAPDLGPDCEIPPMWFDEA